jgi:drug/metabolite transporter (DMT)-like permease
VTSAPVSQPRRVTRTVRATVKVKSGPGMRAPLSATTKESDPTSQSVAMGAGFYHRAPECYNPALMSPTGATSRGFIAIAFWGTSMVAGRLIMGSLGLLRGPLAATLVSGVLGSVLVLARRESRRALAALPPRYWLACGGLFVAYLVAYNLGTGLAAGGRQLLAFNVLNYLWPMATLVFSAVFSQSRVRWWIAPGLVAGLAGTVLALWSQQAAGAGAAASGVVAGRDLLVYGLGLFCGIAWGLYSALGRRLVGPSPANPVPLLFLATAVVYAALLVLGVGAGSASAGAAATTAPSAAGIVAFLWRALVVDLLSYGFWDAAMRRGNQVLAAAASFLTPILSSACIALVLGVSPGWRFWAGALLAVAGAVVCRVSVRVE